MKPPPNHYVASLEGNAVVATDLEAWMYSPTRGWLPLHPADAGEKAAVLHEDEFHKLYPALPMLPATAFLRSSKSRPI